MPVARIFSESASDAAPLVAHLHALGYTVEVASPSSNAESHAELEIRLDRCSRADALAEAERRARELGADIYIAKGALHLAETDHAVIEPEPAQNQSVAPIEAAPRAVRDPLAPVTAVSEAAESFPAHAAEPTAFPAISIESSEHAEAPAVVEVPVASFPESPSATVGVPLETIATHEESHARNTFSFPGEQLSEQPNNAEKVPASSSRAGAILARNIGSLMQSMRHVSSKAGAALMASAQQARQRLREARQARIQRAQEISVVPTATTPVSQSDITSLPSPSQSSGSRLGYRGRPLPWTAFASAGAIVVAALLGWSVLTGRSAAPQVPSNGNIEQQVPFGPVKIVPRSLPSQLPATNLKPASVAAPKVSSTKPAISRSTAKSNAVAKPKKTTRHIAHTARRSREQIADDEVIVHHYTRPKPPTQAKVTNTGIKHISDQD